MQELVRLINIYLDLQKAWFPTTQVVSILKESSKDINIVTVMQKYSIEESYFSVIIEFSKYRTIITSCSKNIDGFETYDSNIRYVTYFDVAETRPIPNFERIIFVGTKDMICFWSPVFNTIIRKIIAEGGDAFLLEKNYIYMCFEEYTILPYGGLFSDNERFRKFHNYISSCSMSYVTKDSDFILKHAFNIVGSLTKPRDISLISYMERVYTGFIYGYIETSYESDAHSHIIFDFWFKDVGALNVFDLGVGHIPCYEFGQFRQFYFVLAYTDTRLLSSGLSFLRSKYNLIVIDYEKSPTYFVKEFMHYKASVAMFNTYFIGIFNRENWVLYADVFHKIRTTLYEGMSDVASALEISDNLTIEEKHNLRFAYFRYIAEGYPEDCEEEYCSNNVPWLALPEPLVTFKKIRVKGGMENPDFSGEESLLLK